MPHINTIQLKEITPGILGQYIHGDNTSVGLVKLEKDASIGEHQHIHEQITFVLKGQLDMIIGGQPCVLTEGMYFVIPSNVTHSAVAKTYCELIDVFNPVREEYR